MKKKFVYMSVCILTLLACQPQMIGVNNLSWTNLTPKGKTAFALGIYNSEYESYMQQAKNPNLTEDQKRFLRNQKQLLIDFHAVLKVYSEYVASGAIPPEDIEKALTNFLIRFTSK